MQYVEIHIQERERFLGARLGGVITEGETKESTNFSSLALKEPQNAVPTTNVSIFPSQSRISFHCCRWRSVQRLETAFSSRPKSASGSPNDVLAFSRSTALIIVPALGTDPRRKAPRFPGRAKPVRLRPAESFKALKMRTIQRGQDS